MTSGEYLKGRDGDTPYVYELVEVRLRLMTDDQLDKLPDERATREFLVRFRVDPEDFNEYGAGDPDIELISLGGSALFEASEPEPYPTLDRLASIQEMLEDRGYSYYIRDLLNLAADQAISQTAKRS